MNGNFFNLPKDRQDFMINGILKVYALNGYKHAATDDIAHEAGVAKGLLFHHFESKLGAYIFAYDYSVKFMTLELSSIVKAGKNPFDTMKDVEKARMNANCGYPYMQAFLNRAFEENVKEALLSIEDKRNAIQEVMDKIYAGIDWSSVPDSVDRGLLIKTLEFTARGLMNEQLFEGSFQPELYYRDICTYIDNLKAAM